MLGTKATTWQAENIGTPVVRLRVTLYQTDVVTIEDGTVTLDSGGYFTPTTKKRMNEASNQFGLNFHVFQEAKKWYVRFPHMEGGEFPFQDGKVSFPLSYTDKDAE